EKALQPLIEAAREPGARLRLVRMVGIGVAEAAGVGLAGRRRAVEDDLVPALQQRLAAQLDLGAVEIAQLARSAVDAVNFVAVGGVGVNRVVGPAEFLDGAEAAVDR